MSYRLHASKTMAIPSVERIVSIIEREMQP
jgi:hypothetical protein